MFEILEIWNPSVASSLVFTLTKIFLHVNQRLNGILINPTLRFSIHWTQPKVAKLEYKHRLGLPQVWLCSLLTLLRRSSDSNAVLPLPRLCTVSITTPSTFSPTSRPGVAACRFLRVRGLPSPRRAEHAAVNPKSRQLADYLLRLPLSSHSQPEPDTYSTPGFLNYINCIVITDALTPHFESPAFIATTVTSDNLLVTITPVPNRQNTVLSIRSWNNGGWDEFRAYISEKQSSPESSFYSHRRNQITIQEALQACVSEKIPRTYKPEIHNGCINAVFEDKANSLSRTSLPFPSFASETRLPRVGTISPILEG